jgi:diguanylate cyclase (GGDEF)-like protein
MSTSGERHDDHVPAGSPAGTVVVRDDEVAATAPASPRGVWLLTAMIALVTTGLAVPEVAHGLPLRLSLTWWLLVPLFAVAEVLVIHLPTQRSSHSHTLREIPAIAGLTFLGSGQYLTAYLLGAALALVLWSHMRGVKLVFNVSMFGLEASLGFLAYHVLLGSGDPFSPLAWAAALAAVLVTDLVSAAAVTGAISLSEGSFDGEVLRQALRSGVPAAVVNGCVAVLIVTLVTERPAAIPLLGVVVGLLVIGYRQYVSLVRGHARTQLLYRFMGSTGHSAELQDVVSTIVAEAGELMRADRVELLIDLPGEDDPGLLRRVSWRGSGAISEDTVSRITSTWWRDTLEGASVLLDRDTANRARQARGTDVPRDGLAVPVQQHDGVTRSVLVVSARAFEQETFDEEDLRVLESLAAHAAVALDKAAVVDRLRRLLDERAHEALHDPLTGLLNRRAFNEALASAIGPGGGSVLLLDLDDFKDVNDTLGHTAGDRLLMVTGERLQGDGSKLVARLGGDEFAVLLPGVALAEAMTIARELHEVVCQPVPLREVMISTSASIGVAEMGRGPVSGEEMLSQADLAMYAAKSARSGVEAYHARDGDSTARRLSLAADLPRAMRDGELQLWFQPQASTATGEVTGFEALLRWDHPRFGWVPPPEIVSVAHRTGLTQDLTGYVLSNALTTRAVWARAGHDIDVSVNVTPRDISDAAIVDRVDALLRETRTPPGALVVEITESDAMRDPERCAVVLGALAARGVRLSVDDFGTGYSSLAYLDRLPVHEVKIDQSFVFRVEKDASDSTIVRATVNLAHDLGLRVVAEGVENDLAKALVSEMGCDLYQGYGLARAMPAREVLDWLTRQNALSRVRAGALLA